MILSQLKNRICFDYLTDSDWGIKSKHKFVSLSTHQEWMTTEEQQLTEGMNQKSTNREMLFYTF